MIIISIIIIIIFTAIAMVIISYTRNHYSYLITYHSFICYLLEEYIR